jgi:hypothetical protein
MDSEILIAIEGLAQKAILAGESHTAYVLGILSRSLQRGDVAELAESVGNFTKVAIFKQTLRELAIRALDSEQGKSNFSEN